MANFQFDTDAGRNLVSAIATIQGNLESELAGLESQVNNTIGTSWQGQSATQFQLEIQDWVGRIRAQMSALQDLQGRLNQEIIDWETMASS